MTGDFTYNGKKFIIEYFGNYKVKSEKSKTLPAIHYSLLTIH